VIELTPAAMLAVIPDVADTFIGRAGSLPDCGEKELLRCVESLSGTSIHLFQNGGPHAH
jgi:hypothetical protein